MSKSFTKYAIVFAYTLTVANECMMFICLSACIISSTGKHISGAPGPAPVLYMFGITMEGHSVLAHIHGFLPYFFVPAQPGFKEDDCGKFKVPLYEPRHPRSLISPFVVRCLDSIIHLVSISKMSILYLASLATQAGLSLTWSQTLKTDFLLMWLICLTSSCLDVLNSMNPESYFNIFIFYFDNTESLKTEQTSFMLCMLAH